MPDIALSVVLITPDSFDTIRTTVRHIQAQTARSRIELLIGAPDAAAVDLPPSAIDGIGAVRVVQVGPIETLSLAKARVIPTATAPAVAFAEDHSFPEPEWAEALIAAFARGYGGVGPEMRNANPDSMLSWAAMFMHFGGSVEATPGEKPILASSHNTAYRRDVLLSLGSELAERLEMELFLQQAVTERGLRLFCEPAARTRHVNISRFAPWTAQNFVGGWLYGALRARYEGWSLARRLLYTCGVAFIPMVRFVRTVRTIQGTSHAAHLIPDVLPALTVGLAAHGLGEAAGYLFGLGATERRYSGYEVRRYDLVTTPDRDAWR